jgi:F-type H+-transporting ATPase subunit delta
VRGASRAALDEAVAHLDATVSGVGAAGLARLADELFGACEVIDGQPVLRRALADPTRPAEARAGLVAVIFEGKVSTEALDVLRTVAAKRWRRPGDLADGLERLAVTAELMRAEAEGSLDEVDDQIFRFAKIVEANPDLRSALADPAMPGDRKADLVSHLLASRATESTVRLVRRFLGQPRGRRPEQALTALARMVADRRARLVAIVRSAVSLDSSEIARLERALSGTYHREVQVKVELDAAVLGGLSIRIGDEIVDGTIGARLDRLKRTFDN